MSNPAKPGWPDLTTLPFMLFGSQPAGAGGSGAAKSPLAQGLSGGMDALKSFWGSLPGGTSVPGFLVPTIDVEELDKRIADLRAAESWLEVNLNILRATIQGLEVQRHTIAAITSLSAMTEGKPAAPPSMAGGLPAGWPTAAKEKPVSPPVEIKAPPAPEPAAPTAATDAAAIVHDPIPEPSAGDTMVGLAANNWLGFMQDQFAKVAQAALVGTTPPAGRAPTTTAVKKATGSAKKVVKKSAKRRRSAAAGPR